MFSRNFWMTWNIVSWDWYFCGSLLLLISSYLKVYIGGIIVGKILYEKFIHIREETVDFKKGENEEIRIGHF